MVPMLSDRYPALLGLGQALLVASAALAPRTVAATIFLSGLTLAAAVPTATAAALRRPWPLPLQIAALLGLYLLISLGWSAARLEGAGKLAIYVGLVGVLAVARPAIASLPDRALRLIALGTTIGVGVALALLAIDELTGQALRRGLYRLLPFAQPPAKHITVVNGELESLASYLSNRSMAMLSLLLWPTIAIVAATQRRTVAIGLTVGALVLAAVAIFRSQHETSMVALLVALITFALTLYAPRAGLAATAIGWTVATLLVVPAVALAYQGGLHQSKSLPYTAAQRVILWGYTAEQIPKRPMLGVGLASTKTLDALAGPHTPPPGYTYARRTGPHAHNIYLQTWYELGALGAALLLALGATLLRAIDTMAPAARPHLLAAFASAAVIAAFSWSMWQAWFMAAFALAMMLAMLAAECARRTAGQTENS